MFKFNCWVYDLNSISSSPSWLRPPCGQGKQSKLRLGAALVPKAVGDLTYAPAGSTVFLPRITSVLDLYLQQGEPLPELTNHPAVIETDPSELKCANLHQYQSHSHWSICRPANIATENPPLNSMSFPAINRHLYTNFQLAMFDDTVG